MNSSLSSKRRRNLQLSNSYENRDVSEGKVKIPFPNEKIQKISRESINFYCLTDSDLLAHKSHKYDHIASNVEMAARRPQTKSKYNRSDLNLHLFHQKLQNINRIKISELVKKSKRWEEFR